MSHSLSSTNSLGLDQPLTSAGFQSIAHSGRRPPTPYPRSPHRNEGSDNESRILDSIAAVSDNESRIPNWIDSISSQIPETVKKHILTRPCVNLSKHPSAFAFCFGDFIGRLIPTGVWTIACALSNPESANRVCDVLYIVFGPLRLAGMALGTLLYLLSVATLIAPAIGAYATCQELKQLHEQLGLAYTQAIDYSTDPLHCDAHKKAVEKLSNTLGATGCTNLVQLSQLWNRNRAAFIQALKHMPPSLIEALENNTAQEPVLTAFTTHFQTLHSKKCDEVKEALIKGEEKDRKTLESMQQRHKGELPFKPPKDIENRNLSRQCLVDYPSLNLTTLSVHTLTQVLSGNISLNEVMRFGLARTTTHPERGTSPIPPQTTEAETSTYPYTATGPEESTMARRVIRMKPAPTKPHSTLQHRRAQMRAPGTSLDYLLHERIAGPEWALQNGAPGTSLDYLLHEQITGPEWAVQNDAAYKDILHKIRALRNWRAVQLAWIDQISYETKQQCAQRRLSAREFENLLLSLTDAQGRKLIARYIA